MNAADARWMRRALILAERGRSTTHPNPRVGCVIVRDGRVAGEGWHRRAGEPHAEIHALDAAGTQARGADVYVTLEPCAHQGRTPPCVDALIAAGVGRVFVAMDDPNPLVSGRGLERLRAAGIEVKSGLCGDEAVELNRGFVSRMTLNRPWVTLKLAASLDGRTAMASGESHWITGEAARAAVHRLRAEAGAVLTSSATVLVDDPRLTVRLPETARQPDRIVIDSSGRVPVDARVWAPGARRIALAGAQAPEAWRAALQSRGVLVTTIECRADGHVALPAALQALAAAEINEVLIECGPGLAGALLQENRVDELRLHLAPCLLGDNARPLARLPGLRRLADTPRWHFVSGEALGADWCFVLRPAANGA